MMSYDVCLACVQQQQSGCTVYDSVKLLTDSSKTCLETEPVQYAIACSVKPTASPWTTWSRFKTFPYFLNSTQLAKTFNNVIVNFYPTTIWICAAQLFLKPKIISVKNLLQLTVDNELTQRAGEEDMFWGLFLKCQDFFNIPILSKCSKYPNGQNGITPKTPMYIVEKCLLSYFFSCSSVQQGFRPASKYNYGAFYTKLRVKLLHSNTVMAVFH